MQHTHPPIYDAMTLSIWPVCSSLPALRAQSVQKHGLRAIRAQAYAPRPFSPEPTLFETTVKSFTWSFRFERAPIKVSSRSILTRQTALSTATSLQAQLRTRSSTQPKAFISQLPSPLQFPTTQRQSEAGSTHLHSRQHRQT